MHLLCLLIIIHQQPCSSFDAPTNAGLGRVTCQLGRRAFCQACPAENRQSRQDGQCQHLPPKPCQPSQHVPPVSVPGPAYSIPIRRLECVHQTTVSTPMSRPTVMSSKSAHHCWQHWHSCGGCTFGNSSSCSRGMQGSQVQQAQNALAQLSSFAVRQASLRLAGVS